MSFELRLGIEGLTEAQGRAVEAECQARKAWPLRFLPRRRRLTLRGLREFGPYVSVPEDLGPDQPLLSDQAEWNAPAWALNAEVLPRFADAIRVLGEELPQGFTLRVTWSGSEVRDEQILSAHELADLALASGLNEFSIYRVPARAQGRE